MPSTVKQKRHAAYFASKLTFILGLTGKKEGKTRLMNMVMQLRKVTCHPYLFDGAVRFPSSSRSKHVSHAHIYIRNRALLTPLMSTSWRTAARWSF